MKRLKYLVRGCAGLLIFSMSASGQETPAKPLPLTMIASDGPRHFVSEHRGTFNDHRIRYQVSVDETIVKDLSNQPISSLVTFTYLAKDVKDGASRPVLFVFNGGPGGSSSPLHFSGVGPKRLTAISARGFADTQNKLIDNPLSPLDVADLVFIDPTDTGYSRTYPATSWQELYSVDGDSDCVTAFIVHWLLTHARTTSPVFLWGESYGTMRAVAVARDLTRSSVKVSMGGVVFSGEAITYGTWGKVFDPIRPVLSLPMMASLAYHYGKIDNKNQTWDEAVDKARVFGRSEYLQALMKRYNLEPAERERIIKTLPGIVGIPESYFRTNNTMVIRNFNKELLKDQGLVLDSNNGLETTPASQAVGDDHSRDFSAESAGLSAAMDKYADSELHVIGFGRYSAITPTIMRLFDQWNFTTASDSSLDITLSKAMKDNPRMKVLVLQGRYDTLTTLGVTEYTMDQTDMPRDRYKEAYFDGGHFLIATPEAMGAVHHFLASD
jgi:carboxypeptidase C (cathepsin A)